MSTKLQAPYARAYQIFIAAEGACDLAELNQALEAEGFKPIVPRMYTHLRKLHKDGFPAYIPANQHEQWRKNRRTAGTGHVVGEATASLLRGQNPWWRGEAGRDVGTFRRWLFPRVLRALTTGFAPAVSLRGPRRVGKTVLVRQVIDELLATGVMPERILLVSFDEIQALRNLTDPILAVARWFESAIVGISFNDAARAGHPAYLLFDEVQNLPDWAPQLKSLVDSDDIRVLITGSSSLRIEAGRDSLAGRISTLELGPLLLREIAELRSGQTITPYWPNGGIGDLAYKEFWLGLVRDGRMRAKLRDEAFRQFSARGAFPIAHNRPDLTRDDLADYLRESIVERAIKHDLHFEAGRGPWSEDLLSELLRLCCRYAGQPVQPKSFVRELNQTMGADTTEQMVRDHLNYLDKTLLMRSIRPMEIRIRKTLAPSRICIADPSIRASWLGEHVPLDPGSLGERPEMAVIAGHLAESTAGYFLSGIPALDVRWLPERNEAPEVDLVLGVGDTWIPIEIKYRSRIDPSRDTVGLIKFLDQPYHRSSFGIVISQGEYDGPIDPRIVVLPLSSLLWMK